MNTAFKNLNSRRRRQSGMTLIEIMVALLLGLILTGGAIEIFLSNKSTYRLESELSRMQETGRFIVDIVSKEIRMAGYMGCASRGNIETNVIADEKPPEDVTTDNSILGYEGGSGSWTPSFPASITPAMNDIDGVNSRDVISNTDVVMVQRADSCGASVSGNWQTTNANVQIHHPNQCGFSQQQVLMVTNCRTADVFAIVNNPTTGGGLQTLTHSNSANTGNFLSENYGPDSQIHIFRSNLFFIAPGESGMPALYMAQWDPTNASGFNILELADGVQDMQIRYGVDNAGGDEYADDYVTANNVTDWSEVRSVRADFLLQSIDNLTTEPRDFTFNGQNANTGNDRRLRMAFSTTISIRNRLQ